MLNTLGQWFETQRHKAAVWFWAFMIFLALLLLTNMFLLPHHPHFSGEHWPGFWALFGFGGAAGLTVVLKKIVAPLLGRPEDVYDRD